MLLNYGVGEDSLESSLDCKIKPVNLKGNQCWIFIGRTDAEAETPKLWSSDAKNWIIRKDPDAWKYWRQEEKGMTEDEMNGWYPWLDGPKFEQAPGVDDGQGSLVCCSPWGHKELDATEWLNWLTDPLPKKFKLIPDNYIVSSALLIFMGEATYWETFVYLLLF